MPRPIPGLRCRGSSANGGELIVGERTRLPDLGLDISCVLTVAGEAAVSAIVRQAIPDNVQPLQDKFAYCINDGIYVAFNNLLFDQTTARPRRLRDDLGPAPRAGGGARGNGMNGEDAALRALTGRGGEGRDPGAGRCPLSLDRVRVHVRQPGRAEPRRPLAPDGRGGLDVLPEHLLLLFFVVSDHGLI